MSCVTAKLELEDGMGDKLKAEFDALDTTNVHVRVNTGQVVLLDESGVSELVAFLENFLERVSA